MLLSGALICKMRGWDGCAVGTLPYPRPCGQQPLPLRPVVWTMKSKPSVPRTWRRRSTSGEKGAASTGCGLPAGRGRETAPTKSEEEISNNSWKCVRRGRTFQPQELREGHSGRLATHGGFPGAGGAMALAQTSLFLHLRHIRLRTCLLHLSASRLAPPDFILFWKEAKFR